MAAGMSLFGFGVLEGHQGPFDAVLSGLVMIAGTGVFMVVRQKLPFRKLGLWYTAIPLASAEEGLAPCRSRWLIVRLAAGMVGFSVLAVGLSFLTGFWLTYMDLGVWAITIGAVKAGPGAAAIAASEASSGTRYRVVRRRLRGQVTLTADQPGVEQQRRGAAAWPAGVGARRSSAR